MANPQSFVQEYGPVAAEVGAKIGVAPELLLGQWGLETGWGKSVIPGTHNLGNIKDFSGSGVAATDNMTGSRDKYRAYDTPSAFGSDFASLISRKYKGALNAGSDAQAFGKGLKSGGYAEDPAYGTKLTGAVSMVRKLGETLANAISGTAQAAEAPPAKLAADPLWKMLNGSSAGAAPAVDAKLAEDPTWQLLNGTAATQTATPMPDGSTAVASTDGKGDSVRWTDAAPETTGLVSQAGRQLGLTARAVGHGVGDAVNAVGGILNRGVNTIAGTELPLSPGNWINSGVDAITPEPQGKMERTVNSIASVMANPINYGGNAYLATAKGLGQLVTRGGLIGAGTNALQSSDNQPVTLGSMVNNGISGAVGGALGGPLLAGFGRAIEGASNKLMTAANSAADTGAPYLNRLTNALGYGDMVPPPVVAIPDVVSTVKPRFKINTDGTATPVRPSQGPAVIPSFDAPPIPQPKSVLPPEIQKDNIATMKAIGLDAQRPSAIGGDKFTAGQEYQNSKLDTGMGTAWRNQLALEQEKIKGYAQNIADEIGAKAASPEAVGQTIRAPLQGLSAHYDNAIKKLYQTADKRAGGLAGVVPESFGSLLKTTSEFAGKAENASLRRGINAYAKEQGIVGQDGAVQPITVEQAEGLRQYLNSQWSPQNSGLIGKIKNALDTDVTKAGGDDIYTAARALHAERKNTLDNPNGIASLLNEKGPNGINQQIPDEKITAKVLAMPTNQLKHVVDTINSLPKDLAPQGQQALAEMKAALARQIYKAGDNGGTQNGRSLWNAANVTRELNSQRSKIALLFSPEEIAKFQTLNKAGHILQAPSAYPGAAVQGHNLLMRGMIYAPPALGAGVGHLVGGVPGAFVGGGVGNMLSKKMATASETAQVNKLQKVLSDPKPIQ